MTRPQGRLSAAPSSSSQQRSRAMALVLLSLAASQVAQAGDLQASPCCPAPDAVLQLEASAATEVVPDRTVMVLSAVAQGGDVAALNAEVARRLDAAVRSARATAGVQVRTGAFTTTPLPQPQPSDAMQGVASAQQWRVSAQLILRAGDAKVLSALGAQLARSLQIEAVGSEMSDALRQREQAVLSAQAIAQFRAQAAAAARDFGYRSYALGQVQLGRVQGADSAVQPMMRALAAVAPNPAIPIESGTRRVSITVSGSVRLLP